MADEAVEKIKADLRRKATALRAAMLPQRRAEASAAAAAHFLAEVTLAPTDMVAAFWPIRDEIDVKPILTRLMDAGQPVCLPVIMGEGLPLDLRHWLPGTPLYPSGFGTLAPDELAPRVTPDVILMPLLGFDRVGTRLGYGGGYYDRTLMRLERGPRLIGFAFECQAFERIPRAPHDVPLDAIVTEAGVMHFAKAEAV
jgi:5-formyltetrahydrofolate cyclo-ligase